jgi:thiamine-monophosphate kinase
LAPGVRSISEVGEFALIARIERALRRARATVGASVALGIGDDAALLRVRPGEQVAVSTDALVESVHFRWETEPADAIGRRAMTAALSDLAAMGARPLGVVVALAAPPGLALARVDGLVRGLGAVARCCGAPLVGGNLTRARDTALALTAIGAVRAGRALRRDAARAGDRVFVTGTLGGAALAVARAARRTRRRAARRGEPEPRLAAGRALAVLQGAGACIDLSDGLLADLGHVLAASCVGATLEPDQVPRPPGFARACAALGLDPERLALTGGEDYELCFTVRRGGPGAEALGRRLGVAVTEIGRIDARRGLRGVTGRGGTGWRHF